MKVSHCLLVDDRTGGLAISSSILFSKGIISHPVERDVTVKAVFQGLDKLKSAEKLLPDVPAIVLGGEGFIGSELVRGGGKKFHSFDVGLGKSFSVLFERLRDRPIIVLNVTKKGALASYIPYLWPEAVLVNEVYPEPTEKELQRLKETGATCYHIVGPRGKAWPGFQRGYAGGIPFCTSFWPEDGGRGYEVLVKKL